MNVIIFGATGMVGHGTLLACLDDPDVRRVVSIVRRPAGIAHEKLEEIVHADFFDYRSLETRLTGLDACLFCLGVSSAGMREEEYRRLTYDLTMAAANTLHRLNPEMAFCYVSGVGTDSSEKGRAMWARVKGKTENDLLKLFSRAYMFRPGYIHPERGAVSRTPWVRASYMVFWPVGYLLTKFPSAGTTTSILGRAMLAAARSGAPAKIVNVRDINALGAAQGH